MINGASFGSPFLSMVPDAVLKTVVTAAPHWGTSIPFKRVLCSAQSGPSRMAECFKRRAMSRKRKNSKKIGAPMLHCLNPNAAGVDVGATEIYIAVPVDRDPQPVRHFSTFTEDLHAAADWLKACNIETVAMESTGVYWIPFFQILEARGFTVVLVNARHVKNVPGRKSDVSDCQWLQYLHSVGLLRGSFRPEQAVCTVRSILRHRDSLVQMASSHVQHMQKALDQMNLQLHHVQRYHRCDRNKNHRGHLSGGTQPAYAGGTTRWAGQGLRGYHRQVAGGRLSARASVHARPVAGSISSLPRVDQGM